MSGRFTSGGKCSLWRSLGIKKAPFGADKKKINGEQTLFTKGLTKDCPVEMNKKRIINQQLNLKLRMA